MLKVPVHREILSAEQFRQVAQDPSIIERVRFIPPTLGKGGFGRFDVEYRIPQMKEAPLYPANLSQASLTYADLRSASFSPMAPDSPDHE